MDWFNGLRSALEILYFAGGIVVAIVAIYGLKQIDLFRKSIRIQSKRDALRLTAEQCNFYLTKVIPVIDDFHSQVRSKKMNIIDGWNIEIDGSKISVSNPNKVDFSRLDELSLHEMLNAMETFATYFVCGVADEQIAYGAVGTTMTNTLDGLIAIILNYRRRGFYKNLVSLYTLWKKRSISEKAIEQKKELESKIEANFVEPKMPFGMDI